MSSRRTERGGGRTPCRSPSGGCPRRHRTGRAAPRGSVAGAHRPRPGAGRPPRRGDRRPGHRHLWRAGGGARRSPRHAGSRRGGRARCGCRLGRPIAGRPPSQPRPATGRHPFLRPAGPRRRPRRVRPHTRTPARSEELAAIDARRAVLLAGAGRPVEALQIADQINVSVSPRTRSIRDRPGDEPAQPGPVRRGRGVSRRAIADQSESAGWLARRGIALHVLNEAHALAWSGRYAKRAVCSSRPPSERGRRT